MQSVENSANQLIENRAWYEHSAASWARWLRAGGQLGEWADNTFTDIQFASQTLDVREGDTVLNLSCGWGRHAIALAHYGLRVIGLDASADLLELARETSEQAAVSITWVHGDLSDLVLEDTVDAVVQFRSNLLDWTEGPAAALHLLDLVHAILKPGGRFLFGTPDWEATPPRQEESQSETPETTELYQHSFDPRSRTVRSHTVVIGRDGSRREYRHRAWHPTVEQVAALLYQADFVIEGQLNDFGFLPYDPSRPGLVWLARKA